METTTIDAIECRPEAEPEYCRRKVGPVVPALNGSNQ